MLDLNMKVAVPRTDGLGKTLITIGCLFTQVGVLHTKICWQGCLSQHSNKDMGNTQVQVGRRGSGMVLMLSGH